MGVCRYLDNVDKVVTRGSYRGTVVIPEEVTYMNRTRKVTSIGEEAFYRESDLTSVIIGNSVKTIGTCAFQYCHSLTSVTIPKSVTMIGNSAFADCNLQEVISNYVG